MPTNARLVGVFLRLVARSPLLAQPLIYAIHPAGELIDALRILLRLACSRLRGGQRVAGGAVGRRMPGIDPVDPLVHGSDLLVDVTSRSAAAWDQGTAENCGGECHLGGGNMHSISFRECFVATSAQVRRTRGGKRNKATRSAIRSGGMEGGQNRRRLT